MSKTTTDRTFVDACLNGEAFPSDVDDWVDLWHDTEFAAAEPTLDEFLGFSEDEGKLWVEKPLSLGVILAARKKKVPLQELIEAESQRDYALAARSESPAEAKQLLEWLIARGRIEPSDLN